jgi:hypothetical protein
MVKHGCSPNHIIPIDDKRESEMPDSKENAGSRKAIQPRPVSTARRGMM